ncbi:MAG: tRNA pseudouridine(38-40) synthase TruA [bacterium]|nr:tRNA pseudouridine(38-40) synthase TruA [bacterium]
MSAAAGGTRTFRLVLEYEGAGFEGWQVQAGARPARTVQGVLAEALESVTGRTPRVRGAGRTDAGVHAEGQVASVHVETGLVPERLQAALNARLPDDVAVRGLVEATPGWDALRAARGKHYRYRIWNGVQRSPLRAGTCWWVREPLDLEAIERAAQGFEGRHDFAAFQAAGSSVKTTARTVTRCAVFGETRGDVRLDVEGEGFLRHMVRNLAGTLVEIGRGRWPVERAAEILTSRDRGQAGPTAPAHGLCLIRVDDDGGLSPAGAAPAAQVDPVDCDGPVG